MPTGAPASMMANINQQSADQLVTPAEATMRQQALVKQQTELVTSLVKAETQLKATEEAAPTASDKELSVFELKIQRRQVEGLRAQLAETRVQLKAQQGQALPAQVETIPSANIIFGIPRDEAIFAGTFLLLFPLVITFALRMLKRGQLPMPASSDRLDRLEVAVESIAVELERLGESQSFASKMLSEVQPQSQPVLRTQNFEKLMRTPV